MIMKGLLAALTAIAAAWAVMAAPSASQDGAAIAIEHATVFPMDRERLLVDHTILVRDGVIERVGPSAGMSIPAGARRIDGRGQFVIPGLADMHVHLYDTEGFPSYLAYGVTSIANLHGGPHVLRWRAQQRRGALAGPTVYTAGPTVNGYPAGNPLFVSVRDPDEARAIVREQKAAGYDFIKVYAMLDPLVYRAIIDEARHVGIPVLGHYNEQVGMNEVLRAGQTNIAHIEEFFQDGDIPDDSMPAMAQRVRASGASVTVNLFAYADYLRTIADYPGVLGDPEMQYASPAQYSEKIPTSNRAINRPDLPAFADFLRRRQPRFRRLTKAFMDAGVPLLLGTDTETFGFPGQSAYLELLLLGDAGLTNYQALEAATKNAGLLAVQSAVAANRERFGTLEPGSRADMVLVDANPLADLTNVRRIVGVMARGRWYSATTIDSMRKALAVRTAPQRAFVARFDSMFMQRSDVAGAAALLDEFQRKNPGVTPFAELVWRGYGRLKYADDKPSSNRIRTMLVQAFPESFAAHNEVARGHLFAGDTARALVSFARSLRLSPRNFAVRDMLEKVEARRGGASSTVVGSYSFAPFQARKAYAPTLTIIPVDSGYAARLTAKPGEKPVDVFELVIGDNRVWASATVDDRDLELRFTIDGDSVRGWWAHGFSTNGALRGAKRR